MDIADADLVQRALVRAFGYESAEWSAFRRLAEAVAAERAIWLEVIECGGLDRGAAEELADTLRKEKS